jgi:hypothetical protein
VRGSKRWRRHSSDPINAESAIKLLQASDLEVFRNSWASRFPHEWHPDPIDVVVMIMSASPVTDNDLKTGSLFDQEVKALTLHIINILQSVALASDDPFDLHLVRVQPPKYRL